VNKTRSTDIAGSVANYISMKRFLILLFIVLIAQRNFAQPPSSMQTLRLDDMSAFRPQAGNWQIVGDVLMDPSIDIHGEQKAPPSDSKGKKKKGNTPEPPPRQAVTATAGKGILLNMNDHSKKDNLVTSLEHGDIELELEVMIPKGSNSGIYLQGRYEVQLLDSWGVSNPSFSDIGGIYRNWETVPGKIYMGKAPITNAAKAPGLWQTMKISFRAPRFDASGNKIANARFESVELNGIRIHSNVDVPLPTGGPIKNNEEAMGPLMIQGDHGPVAFRNIRYRLLKESEVTLSEVKYKTWYGEFKLISDFMNQKPASEGETKELTCEVLEKENGYASLYTGFLTLASDGEYNFNILFTGGGKFTIDNTVLVDVQRPDAWVGERKNISLKAGRHSFEIYNFKDASWMPPRLGLFAEAPDSHAKSLHAFNSFPPNDDPRGPILVNAGSSPKLLRAFLDFRGDRTRRLTHTIGVGLPGGLNYIYDLAAGNLVCVWRGEFVDATPMWEDRGDGSFRPRGAPLFLFTTPPLAALSSQNEAFPPARTENDFRSRGYVINDTTGLPVFKYLYKNVEVEDRITNEDQNRSIGHQIIIKSSAASDNFYFKIAEGASIVRVPDGSFAVNGKQYYIRLHAGVEGVVRESNGVTELIVPLKAGSVRYSIVW
jgi:hypothetical protein